MLIRRLKAFREETKKRYEEGLQSQMEPWKLRVMKLHEEAEFLFYYHEINAYDKKDGRLELYGELVKGLPHPGDILYFYDGQGERLCDCIVESEAEEPEQDKPGLFREQRSVFWVKLLTIYEDPDDTYELMNRYLSVLSIVADK